MKQWLKKRIQTFIVNERGAVSIYLIIVVICLFFFNAVLIDYARILVAEAQTERAAKTAVRSTMASFDPALHRYGLFGLNDQHPTKTFRSVFAKNLSIQQSGFFHFTDTQMVKGGTKVTINHNKMLSNPYTFKHQILENMKYRAPIEFTSAIIDGFLKVSKAMEEASTFADIASDIDKKAQKRKKALEQVESDLLKTQTALREMDQSVNGGADADFPDVKTLSDIVAHEKTYKEIMSRDQSKGDVVDSQSGQDKYDKSDARTFEREAQSLITRLTKKAKTARTGLKEALVELSEAKQQNQSIKKTITEKRKQKENDYAAATRYENKYGKSNGTLNGAEKNLKQANRKLNDYVMDDHFFTTMKKEINTALDKINTGDSSLLNRLNQFNRVVPYQLEDSSQTTLMRLKNETRSSHKPALGAAKDSFKFFETHRKTYEDKETKEKEEQADKSLKTDKKTLNQLIEEAKSVAGDTKVYQTLQKLVKKYDGQSSGKPEKANMEDPSETSDDAMAMMDKLFHQIGQALKKERNKIYINEYILTRFKSHDFSIKGPSANNFQNNEVEYIIYGIPAHGANYAAALSELFVIRFAINFVAAFTQTEVRATGPFIFWAAIAYALGHTAENFYNLIERGKPIKLMPRLFYNTDYKDYLRLFLFLHPRGHQLSRLMAVINQNSGRDLARSSTYITGTSTSTVSLWFIPGICKLLGKIGMVDGSIKKGRYYITKRAAYSY